MLSENAQSALDTAEYQHGQTTLFHWTRELIDALKGDEKEAIQEYMESFIPEDWGDYYGFRGGNPEKEIPTAALLQISDEELLNGDWLGVSLLRRKENAK